MKFGAHMPTVGGVWRALEHGASLGCEIVQLFVKNNMQWFGKPYPPAVLGRFAALAATHRFARLFAHAGYLINLAAPAGEKRDKSLASLIQEVELAGSLGLPFLVLHPGAHLGQGEPVGLRQAATGLDEVFRATRDSFVRIALENTAGQGTCLGHRLDHLAQIYDHVGDSMRLGLCLDTAHLFAAGFDLRTKAGWNVALKQVDDLIGFEQVLAFHLNDSKTPLNSRVDRHAGIGQGHIGRAAFRHIVNDPRCRDLPGCLETPKSADLHEDRENLAVLRSLAKSLTKNRKSVHAKS